MASRGRLGPLLGAALALSPLVGIDAAGPWLSTSRAEVPPRFVPWKEPGAPPLVLKDSAGRVHALADHRGRVVLVNFWATWCDPCRDEMPSLQRLKERLAGQPFAILAVNYGESARKVDEFLARTPADFQVLLDPGQQVARAWRVRVLPASFLVDPDGRVRYAVIGELDWASADAERAVRALLP